MRQAWNYLQMIPKTIADIGLGFVCATTIINGFSFFIQADDDAKKVVRIVAIVFCVLAMAALIATIRMAKKLEYVFLVYVFLL